MKIQKDDAKRLRIRDVALVDRISQTGRDPSLGMPCVVAQTKSLSRYPTSAQQFYACSPLTILGLEVEGGPGTIVSGTSTFFALNLGSVVPPNGANVVATFVDNRWVFRYDG
jgi:hypothetical protein